MTKGVFPALKNNNFIKACYGEEVDRIPIFVHRQAGRYLPEYLKLKGNKDFFELVRTPELACKITLQPLRRFDMDAAIIFSDILVIPQAIGFEVKMVPKKGPLFPNPLEFKRFKDLSFDINLSQKLSYVYKAISTTRVALEGKVPLIGFSGGPWTLMCYLIEGKSDKTLKKSKNWLKTHPSESHTLLSNLTVLIAEHLVLQVKAGAQVVEVFDTLAGYLSESDFKSFLLPQLTRLVRLYRDGVKALATSTESIASHENPRKRLKIVHIESEKGIPAMADSVKDCEKVDKDYRRALKSPVKGDSASGLVRAPIILFPKGANHSLEAIGSTGCDVLAVDWNADWAELKALQAKGVTVMGNLDPNALYQEKVVLVKTIRQMVGRFGRDRYIANLGHGMRPDMDSKAVEILVDAVHQGN